MGSTIPSIDPGARQRLTARFGGEVEAWFDDLPSLLTALADRWQFEIGSPIPRGSVSAEISGVPDPSHPTVGQRVAYLFHSSAKLYEQTRSSPR